MKRNILALIILTMLIAAGCSLADRPTTAPAAPSEAGSEAAAPEAAGLSADAAAIADAAARLEAMLRRSWRVSDKIADGKLLSLIEAFLKAPIQDGQERLTPTAGTPQGAVLSPLLSNIYLNPLDHLMAQSGYQMVRYADDCAPGNVHLR